MARASPYSKTGAMTRDRQYCSGGFALGLWAHGWSSTDAQPAQSGWSDAGSMTNDEHQTNGLNRGSARLREKASHRVRTLSIAGGAAALAGTAALTVALVPAATSTTLTASTTTVTATTTAATTTAAATAATATTTAAATPT